MFRLSFYIVNVILENGVIIVRWFPEINAVEY